MRWGDFNRLMNLINSPLPIRGGSLGYSGSWIKTLAGSGNCTLEFIGLIDAFPEFVQPAPYPGINLGFPVKIFYFP
jgi:hypothetical protein